jgi:hypothetical protein
MLDNRGRTDGLNSLYPKIPVDNFFWGKGEKQMKETKSTECLPNETNRIIEAWAEYGWEVAGAPQEIFNRDTRDAGDHTVTTTTNYMRITFVREKSSPAYPYWIELERLVEQREKVVSGQGDMSLLSDEDRAYVAQALKVAKKMKTLYAPGFIGFFGLIAGFVAPVDIVMKGIMIAVSAALFAFGGILAPYVLFKSDRKFLKDYKAYAKAKNANFTEEIDNKIAACKSEISKLA